MLPRPIRAIHRLMRGGTQVGARGILQTVCLLHVQILTFESSSHNQPSTVGRPAAGAVCEGKGRGIFCSCISAHRRLDSRQIETIEMPRPPTRRSLCTEPCVLPVSCFFRLLYLRQHMPPSRQLRVWPSCRIVHLNRDAL